MIPATLDPCARKHGGNPESQAAWQFVRAGNDSERILSFYSNGAKLTPKEVAQLMDKPLHAISGRFVGLRGGKLRKTGVVRDGSAELEATEVSQ